MMYSLIACLLLVKNAVRHLKLLRQFLAKINSHIERSAQPYIPALQRTNDAYLMDLAIQSNGFTAKEMTHLNYCRLYLQVVNVADIMMANSTKVDDFIAKGVLSPGSSMTTWLHVNKQNPDDKTWHLWTRLTGIVHSSS